MVRYLAGGLVLRMVAEIRRDLVRHADEISPYHVALSQRRAGTSVSTRSDGTLVISELVDACRRARTCTAVTLYSGQFVAQSECSVVTTLAPVTGW